METTQGTSFSALDPHATDVIAGITAPLNFPYANCVENARVGAFYGPGYLANGQCCLSPPQASLNVVSYKYPLPTLLPTPPYP